MCSLLSNALLRISEGPKQFQQNHEIFAQLTAKKERKSYIMHIEMANKEIEVKIVCMHISFGKQITMENAPNVIDRLLNANANAIPNEMMNISGCAKICARKMNTRYWIRPSLMIVEFYRILLFSFFCSELKRIPKCFFVLVSNPFSRIRSQTRWLELENRLVAIYLDFV